MFNLALCRHSGAVEHLFRRELALIAADIGHLLETDFLEL